MAQVQYHNYKQTMTRNITTYIYIYILVVYIYIYIYIYILVVVLYGDDVARHDCHIESFFTLHVSAHVYAVFFLCVSIGSTTLQSGVSCG